MNAKQLWQAALERLRPRISAASYATWFKATEGVELTTDGLAVAAPNSFAAEHLHQRFYELAARAVAEVTGRPLSLSFQVRARQQPTAAVPDASAPSSERVPADSSVSVARRRPTVSPRLRHERRATLDLPRAPVQRGRAAAISLAQPPLLSPDDGAMPRTPAPSRQSAALAEPDRYPVSMPSPRAAFAADPSARHTFASFVVGTTNRLAYAAAQEVAARPGQRYNPLFIYGGTGLGKTHLLLAIGNAAHRQGLSVCYVAAERFANDMIEAIRHHTTDAFRARYRWVDVLLVDDTQFIAGKEATEEEFFHTFNALHDANRQIVLSSDRSPGAMRPLHDRLRSRFEWGLLADIQPPDLTHRLDILRAKAAERGLALSETVLAAIARVECSSVRELEGALNRVLAYATMLGRPVDASVVAHALAPLQRAQRREPSAEEVLAVVAHHFGVSSEALRGKARDHAIAWPRQVAMYLLREETPASLCQIGQTLGGRDHTTVMHGCAHVGRAIGADEQVRRELESLRAALRS